MISYRNILQEENTFASDRCLEQRQIFLIHSETELIQSYISVFLGSGLFVSALLIPRIHSFRSHLEYLSRPFLLGQIWTRFLSPQLHEMTETSAQILSLCDATTPAWPLGKSLEKKIYGDFWSHFFVLPLSFLRILALQVLSALVGL